MLVFAFSMFGWGSLINQGDRSNRSISLTIVIGMGITLFAGGFLNIVNAGHGETLNVYLGFGVLLALWSLKLSLGKLKEWLGGLRKSRATVFAFIFTQLALFVYLSNTVMIPDAFNLHDDYQKYFVHPVKMIATGSAFGSPLSSIGKDVFGGQALLQGVFVHNLGIRAINAFDSVFCLLLGATLIMEEGIRRGVFWLSLLSVLVLALIHPQYVNISALYSGGLFILAIIFISSECFGDGNAGWKDTLRFSVPLGILYAALVALKTTNGLFPILHFTIFILLITALTRNLKVSGSIAIFATLAGVFFVSPWLFTLISNLHSMSGSLGSSLSGSVVAEPADLSFFFSTKASFYGGHPLQYSVLVALSLLAGISTLFLFRYKEGRTRGALVAATTAGGAALLLCYAVILIALPPAVHSYSTSLRYTIPFIIGIAPAVLLLSQQLLKEKHKNIFSILLAILSGVAALQFIPQANARIHQAQDCGSTLSFSKLACHKVYRGYNADVLDDTLWQPARKTKTERWQNHIPKGEALLAWINTPFYLDFTRNRIFEVDISGLDNPWARLPEASYMIWEYNGFATRSLQQLRSDATNAPLYDRRITSKTLMFIDFISNADKEIIYKDNEVKIFRFSHSFPEMAESFEESMKHY